MTNGEKLKETFPNLDTSIVGDGDVIDVYNLGTYCQTFDVEWWNAEYKESTTKNDLGVELIQKADALDCVNWGYSFSDIYKKINDLSSATPIRPKGHWFVDERPESDREVICSNCEQPVFKYHKLDFDYRPKYCPNCGAKMESEDKE